MSEFLIRKDAIFSPTKCAFCDRHEGPFIDTHLDLLGYGHVWVCLGDEDHPGCLIQMGRLAGSIDPWEAEKIRMALADLELVNATLGDELKDLAKQKTISIKDAITIFGSHAVPPDDISEPLRGVAAAYE